MKTGVVSILIFVAAFVLTTAALIFLNTQYKNIFRFDFTPVHFASQGQAADSTGVNNPDSSAVKNDSTKALDSLKNIAGQLDPKKDSLSIADGNNSKTGNNLSDGGKSQNEQNTPVQNANSASKSNEDSKSKPDQKIVDVKKMDQATYEKWKKSTAGIIEAMDSFKAAQILRMYADNIGNELLYAMKKKKAAEILSKFDAKKDSLIIRKLTRMQ